MPFLELTLELQGLAPQPAEEATFDLGALSVTLTDSRDDAVLEPAPGEMRLWPATRLQALFADGTDAGAVMRRARAAARRGSAAASGRASSKIGSGSASGSRISTPCASARACGCVRGHEVVTDPAAVVVLLDPGLAFGTGTHATTAMCLEWLDAHCPRGARVIDFGCGSGILAIAALKLGAERAWCHDIDPQALLATAQNAQANRVASATVICATRGRTARRRGCAAGQHPVRSAVRPRGIASPRWCARAVTSFCRASWQHQEAEVTAAYDAWFDTTPIAVRDGWVALHAVRRVSGPARTPRTERRYVHRLLQVQPAAHRHRDRPARGAGLRALRALPQRVQCARGTGG